MRELIRKIGAHYGALPMSWSRVNLLLTCPRQFDLRYRQKLKDQFIPEDPSAAEAGTLMHKVLEWAVERCVKENDYSYEASMYETLFSMMISQAGYPGTRERMLSLREPTAQVLAKILSMAAKFEAELFTERRFALNRDWMPMEPFSWDNLAWLGYVDLAMVSGERGIVVDYKSEPWSEDRSEKTGMQTLLYAYALMRSMPQVQKVQTVTAFLQDEQVVQSGAYTRIGMPDMEERLIALFTEYLRLLDSGDTAPRASKLCQWCAFSRDCPKESTLEDAWQLEKRMVAM